jgi:DHA1 family bicyclomycin/chloramphenicol resistance-like MFS transporter
MPRIAGVASAVLSGLQMLTGALASAAVAALFDGRSALAMTAPMALCAVLSAAVYAGLVRRAERRLLAPGRAGGGSAATDPQLGAAA